MLSKSEIRWQVRADRQTIDPAVLHAMSARIRESLLALEAVRDATAWFVYASTADEIDTHDLIRELLARGDVVAVPRVVGQGQMIAQQIHAFDELRLSEFGILAPAPGQPYVDQIDVCVCPGLAFSEDGHRLGSGGGYYDRFLAARQPRLAIGLAAEILVRPELPIELHDRPMDYIVTEKRVINCRLF
ncbi:MAG TPA: 5-formyltetrahydrofolate cyclo-ligase [Pirellulales bacterium]